MFFEFVKRNQTYKICNIDELSHWVKGKNESGFQITSCAPYIEPKGRRRINGVNGDDDQLNCLWFVIMTSGFTQPQSNLLESSELPLTENLDGFCYNPNSKTYLTYINSDEQSTKIRKWFEEDQLQLSRLWLREKLVEGFVPYLISKDPNSGKTLIGVRIDERSTFSNVELAMDFQDV